MNHPAHRPLLAAGALVLAGALVIAGPLDPPPGPVAGTYKTLNEVEPRIPINAVTCPGGLNYTYGALAAGSYYLTGDLAGEVGKSVIRVGHNVTIDLNGFSIVGVPGSRSGIDGDLSDAQNVTIRNGVIRSCGGFGVEMDGSSYAWVVEDLQVVDSASTGIYLGRHSVVRNCRVESSGGDGITAQWGSVVENCAVLTNARGIVVGNGSTVSGCAATQNGDGVVASSGSVVTACTARFNNQDGFALDSGSTISRSAASENARDGIRLGTGCSALDNTCANNNQGLQLFGAGIRATGERNRIEGNNVSGNHFGIRAESPGSFIFRNTARGNTLPQAYSFDPGCTYGPIISAAGAVVSANPWANFSQ